MNESDMYESDVVTFIAPHKAGWLEKKGQGRVTKWKRHWFVLAGEKVLGLFVVSLFSLTPKTPPLSPSLPYLYVPIDSCLYYFLKPTDDNPRCIIPLDNTRVGRGIGRLEIELTGADGEVMKSAKNLPDGSMEIGDRKGKKVSFGGGKDTLPVRASFPVPRRRPVVVVAPTCAERRGVRGRTRLARCWRCSLCRHRLWDQHNT